MQEYMQRIHVQGKYSAMKSFVFGFEFQLNIFPLVQLKRPSNVKDSGLLPPIH